MRDKACTRFVAIPTIIQITVVIMVISVTVVITGVVIHYPLPNSIRKPPIRGLDFGTVLEAVFRSLAPPILSPRSP